MTNKIRPQKHPPSSTSSPTAVQGDRECGLQSVHHSLILPLLRERSCSPCCSTGSLTQEKILCELLQCGSIPWAAVLHKLLQGRTLAHGVQSLRHRMPQCGSLQETCSRHGLLFAQVCRPLPGARSRSGLPWV